VVYPSLPPDRILESMGRPKGSQNRTSAEVRAVIAEVIGRRVDDLDTWIGMVAKDDPYRAFQMVVELGKLTIPKPRQNETNGVVPAPMILLSRN
jgi:hypothetical protein